MKGKDDKENIKKDSAQNFINYFFSFLNGLHRVVTINNAHVNSLFFLVGDGQFMIEYFESKGTSSNEPLYYNDANWHYVSDPNCFIGFKVCILMACNLFANFPAPLFYSFLLAH